MNDNQVEAFVNQTFNHDEKKSAISKRNSDIPPDLVFQHLPVKEKAKT